MKKLLLKALADAPEPIVYTQNDRLIYLSKLEHQADVSKQLIYSLMNHYNSACPSQSQVYARLSRIWYKACDRANRRRLERTIADYIAYGITPREEHPLYTEIMADLEKSKS